MKITEKIHALKHTFFIPVNPELKLERFVYSFVIFGKENVYLIDSGVADSMDIILNYIENTDYSKNNIKTLVLTHSHPDHIGSAASIKEKTDCEILAHEEEKEWIENIEKQFSDRPVPGFQSFVNRSVKVDHFIKDNDLIQLETDLSIKVIHTPGHSNGSISLLIKEEKVLICADSLLLPGSLPIYEDAVETINSINKLRRIENINWLLSSWDDPSSEEQIPVKFDQSINYLKTIHNQIKEIKNAKELIPLELCKKVIANMGLPPVAVNPLVAKAFQSNIRNLDNVVFK